MPKRFTVVTITGRRPDFLRMADVFQRLDASPLIQHVLIHAGQHPCDTHLLDELAIRAPDYTLSTGDGVEQLFKEKGIAPDLVVFFGDSDTVGLAFPLQKKGYRIAHIEAGMRSGDTRMLEEINRKVCDHCSDLLFVSHSDDAANLWRENIKTNVHVVGNTSVEVAQRFVPSIIMAAAGVRRKDTILMDIGHRPENVQDATRLRAIVAFGNACAVRYGVPVTLLCPSRGKQQLEDNLKAFGIELGPGIVMVPRIVSYRTYLETVYHAAFLISDSGRAQEEPALLGTRVVVPRDRTERPQSYAAQCSYRLNVAQDNTEAVFRWLDTSEGMGMDVSWLGDGSTSERIVEEMEAFVLKRRAGTP